jgi:hypothetical protein
VDLLFLSLGPDNKIVTWSLFCVDLLFLWVPDSRFRFWVRVLWLLKLTNFSTVVAGIDYLPTKFLWVNKQTKYNTISIIPWEIKVSSPAVF